MTTRFDRDTALDDLGGGVYEGRIDTGWWVDVGPNGGYVAALVLRGLSMAVDDPARTARSLTIHYLAPPAEGPVRITTTVERRGRQLTYVTGRLEQGSRLLALAMGAFSAELAGPSFCDLQMPDVPPPDAVPVMAHTEGEIALRARYEQRWAIGAPPFSGSDVAIAGGWIRLTEQRAADHLLVAAFTDAWMPPLFSRLGTRMMLPTIDLTIHFRAPLPLVGMSAEDPCLVVFRSQVAGGGFIEEDGEVWSASGVLLAHSRQLAITM